MIESRKFFGEVKYHALRAAQLGVVVGTLALVLDGAARADVLPHDECEGQTVHGYFQTQANAEGVRDDGRTTLTQAALAQGDPAELGQCVVAPAEQAVSVTAVSIPARDLLVSPIV